MNIALWIVQVLLAVAFFGAGAMKLGTPAETLVENGMNWVNSVPAWLVPVIGIAEIAGALGLLLPAATKIRPSLTPLAAAGLVVVMVLAAGTHILLGEYPMLVPNVVLGGLAGFVAWGRWKVAPIESRSMSVVEA